MQVAEGCEDLADDALRLLRRDIGGRLRQAVGALPRRLQMKAEAVKELRIFFNILCLVCIERKNGMHEHLLGGNPIRLRRKAVKEDALMRRMLIDDVERRSALSDNVGKVDLPDGKHSLLHGDIVPLRRPRCRRHVRERRTLLCAGLLHSILCRTQIDTCSCPLHGLVDGLRVRRRSGIAACRGRDRRCGRRAHIERHCFVVELRLFHCGGNPRRLSCRAANGVEHRLVDCLKNTPLILKLHLRFLRMHIHINRALRHGDDDDGEREAHLRHEGAVHIVDRLRNRAVLDRPPVDDVGLPRAAAANQGWLRNIARDADIRRIVVKIQRNQCARRIAAVDAPNRTGEVSVSRRHDGHAVVVDEAERNVGA